MVRFLIPLAALVLVACHAATAATLVKQVDSLSKLNAALAVAASGETILVARGSYPVLVVNDRQIGEGGLPATIASADPTHPATFAGLKVSSSSGLVFSHIVITGSRDSYAQIRVGRSDHVSLNRIYVHGDTEVAPSTQLKGLYIDNSAYIRVTNSEFGYLSAGIVANRDQRLTITGNAFHHLSKGGVEMGGVHRVNVSTNSFSDFVVAPRVHSDAIQIYQSAAYGVSTDLTLAHNFVYRGQGAPMMGILLGAEIGQPHVGLVIADNGIFGTSWNGITVSNAAGTVKITDNQIVTWPGLDPNSFQQVSYDGWLYLKNLTAAQLTVSGNSAQNYMGPGGKAVPVPLGNTKAGAIYNGVSVSLARAWLAKHPATPLVGSLREQLGLPMPMARQVGP